MAEKIKDCPICGRKGKLTKYNTFVGNFTRADKYYVCCSKNFRHSEQEEPLGFLTQQEAIQAWNKREKKEMRRNETWRNLLIGRKEYR